ncbi:MAG: HNH endonuclease [bacterium]|nr:HNH endonuclease [bacterium]
MLPKTCLICSKEFLVKKSHLSRGWGKYCSKTCQYSGQQVGKFFQCSSCSKEIYRNNKDQSRSKSHKFFCSKSCQTVWRNESIFIAENHANWTGGESSYRNRLIKTDRDKKCEKCNTVDSRVLAVHHKDKNRKNNSISNLIWLCHNCHYLVHHHANESIGFLVPVA